MIPHFRAWHKKEKRCLVIDSLEYDSKEDIWAIVEPNNKHIFEPDFIFCLSTGLKDIKGKEIFDGDIIEVKTAHFNFWRVYWEQKVCGFQFGFIGRSKKPIANMNLLKRAEEIYKIIGNIYENPELLEGGRK